MRTRRLLPLLAVVAVAGGVAFLSCRRGNDPPPTARPLSYRDHNLVFVSFDALQARHVGALGNPRNVTPTLDAMARDGVLFRQARSVAPWTVPSSMTWFTGAFPSEHRMTNKFAVYNAKEKKTANLKELAPHLTTLAELLRARGYATGGFTGNAGVSGGFGYDQGFDVYFYPQGTFGGFDRSIPEALNWLRANKSRKFFLFLHGYDAHGQNTPSDGFDYRFVEKGYDKRYSGSEQEQETLREEGLERGKLNLRDADIQFWRAVYDEKIARADERFRQFLTEFDALGVTDKTLFVLTSDHGTEFCEHDRFDHGFTLYDELLRVPLIVRLPGQTRGRVISDRVGSIDVMPTILDLLGIPAPEQVQGESLLPAMTGGHVFAETDYREYTFKRAIVAPEGWKLIYTLETKTRELYDLTADPGEQRDRAAVEKDRADELERRLFKHFADLGHDLGKRRWEVGLNPVYASQGQERPKK
jgi:choline-sulfatase